MKQQISGALSVVVWLVGSLAMSSAQAWGPGCYKAYQKEEKACVADFKKESKKIKVVKKPTKEQSEEIEKKQDSAQKTHDACSERALEILLECRLDKDKFIADETNQDAVKRELFEKQKEIVECGFKCDEEGDTRDKENNGATEESLKEWQQCTDKCGKIRAERIKIMEKYISTGKEPSQKK